MERMFFYQRKLRDVLADRVQRNPRYSMSAFAQALGLEPSALSQILSGRRFPSPKMAERIFTRLELSPEERNDFLRSLAQAKEKAGLKRVSPALRKLLKSDTAPHQELTVEIFKTIADWYHSAILELTYVEGFRADPAWIAGQLGISKGEAYLALERLMELELLEEKDGKIVKRDTQLLTADRSLTTAAHRRRQAQVLEKSITSLQNDPIEVRNHTAMTFAIDPEKIPEAKRRIEKFFGEMTDFLESGSRKNVYEMTLNLFPLQKPNPGERK